METGTILSSCKTWHYSLLESRIDLPFSTEFNDLKANLEGVNDIVGIVVKSLKILEKAATMT